LPFNIAEAQLAKIKNPMTVEEKAFLGEKSVADGVWAYRDDDRAALDNLCSRGWLSPLPGEFVLEPTQKTNALGPVVRLIGLYALTPAGAKWLAEPDVVGEGQ
jgi:hypothetical protein